MTLKKYCHFSFVLIPNTEVFRKQYLPVIKKKEIHSTLITIGVTAVIAMKSSNYVLNSEGRKQLQKTDEFLLCYVCNFFEQNIFF